MSFSDLPRRHFYPTSHYSLGTGHFPGYFHQPLPASAFINHELSQLQSAIYAHNAHNQASFNMSGISPDEMERYQELSNKYEPELSVGCSALAPDPC